MKKTLIVIMTILFSLAGSPYVFAQETAEQWFNVYQRASTFQQKYEIMLSIVKQERAGMGSYLVEALDELIQNRSFIDKKEAVVYKELQRLIVQELGRLKVEDSADVLYKALRQTRDPYLRSDIIIAFGQIGATQYASYIASILKDVTLYKGENLKAEEALAYSCVYTLGKFKEPIGYLPVFFAYKSGFSRRVKEEAERAMDTITSNPTEILLDVLINDPDIFIRLEALRAEKMSKASDEEKMAFATEALRMSLITSTRNLREETYIRDIRLEALSLFLELGKPYKDAVKYIEQIIFRSRDITEKMLAIEVLGSIGGEEAVNALSRYLAYNNDRQESGVPPENNLLIITLIRAIEKTGSRAADEELLRAKYVGYSQSIVREATRALEGKK